MAYTLTIIDMQPEFEAANGKRVYNSVLREIKRAIEKRAAIIFVEYGNLSTLHTKTRRGLRFAASHYDRVFDVIKFQNDGSVPIMDCIKRNRLSHHIKVCGVNTDACVISSVRGMNKASKKKAKIQVIADACATANWGTIYDGHEYGLRQMSHLPNVRIKRK